MYLFGIPHEPPTDHEYFAIHEDLFVIIISTHQDVGIKVKTIIKDVSPQTKKECNMEKFIKSKKTIDFTENIHTIQRKSQKTEIDYSNKSLDNFRLVVISPTPTLSHHEKGFISYLVWNQFSQSKC